jgi:hypothetical protein
MIAISFLWVNECIRYVVSSLFHACVPCRLFSGTFVFVYFASPLTPVANGLEAGESYSILHRESALKSLMELLWLSAWQASLLFRLCN